MGDEVLRTSVSLADWRRLEEQLEAIVSQSGASFDPATVANAREFLALARERSSFPSIAKGYWSTICFYWPGLEFEVSKSHIEIYRFFDKSTDIQHHDHRPGDAFSAEVIAALPG